MDLSGLLRLLSVASSSDCPDEEQVTPPDSPELAWRSLVGGRPAHGLTGSSASSRPKSALKHKVSLASVASGERRVRFSPTSSTVTRPERSAGASYRELQGRAQQERREAARERSSEQIEKLIMSAKQQSRHAMVHAGRMSTPQALGDMRAVRAHSGS